MATGLNHPWSVAWLPNGDMLVTERPGRVRLIHDGVLDPTPISGVPKVHAVRLSGLMEVLPHPNFAQNQYVYLTYTKNLKEEGPVVATTLARGRLEGKALVDVKEILECDSWAGDGGSGSRLAWGKDGMLYMTTGASNGTGQELSNTRRRAGDEPLVAVHDPRVAAALGRRADHRRVGAAPGMRLGHHERRADAAVDDRLQPARLLRVGADALERHHRAVVGRRAVERRGAEDRAVHLLVARRHADERQAAAAAGLRHLQRPQPLGARLRAHPRQHVLAHVLVLVVVRAVGLERDQSLVDEPPHAAAHVVDRGSQREVHRVASVRAR